MASLYLMQWVDPALKIKEGETIKTIETAERERLLKLTVICIHIRAMPDRIAEADPEELALDRKRSKRIGHVAEQCLFGWGGKVNPKKKFEQEAAQINWDQWWLDHQTFLINRTRYVATWADERGEQRWGKSAVVKFTNETTWLQYAMRD